MATGSRVSDPGALPPSLMVRIGLGGLGTIWLLIWESLKYIVTSSIPAIIVVIYLFAVWYMHLYQNTHDKICIAKPMMNLTEEKQQEYYKDHSNWLTRADGSPVSCYSISDGPCPQVAECVNIKIDAGFFDLLNFNNIFSSYTSVMVIALNDFSEWICQALFIRHGNYNVIVFSLTIMITYFFVATILATVIAACDEIWRKEKIIMQKLSDERRKSSEQSVKLDRQHSDIPFIDNGHTEDPEVGIIARNPPPAKTTWQSFKDVVFGWECCICCDKVKEIAYKIIFDPFTQVFIIMCLLVHTAIIFMDHHNMSFELAVIHYQNFYWFPIIFCLEALMKIIALSPRGYFKENWNVFEFILAILTIQSLFTMDVVFSFAVLLIMVRLARFWPSYSNMHQMNARASKSRWQYIVLIGSFLLIMAAIGMNVHGGSFEAYMKEKDRQMRWHTVDFAHSFMLVFRGICGEWVESLLDCIEVNGGWTCFPFFIVLVIFGDLLLINIFTVLLLSSFQPTENDENEEPVTQMIDIVSSAVDRITNAWNWLTGKVGCRALDCRSSSSENLRHSNSTETATAEILEDASMTYVCLQDEEKETIKAEYSKETNTSPGPCCGQACYKCLPPSCADIECCVKLREFCFRILNNQFFDLGIIFIILLATIFIGLKDRNITDQPTLSSFINYSNEFITVIYLVEMAIRIIGLGCKDYFTSGWRTLDFLLVVAMAGSLVHDIAGAGRIPIFVGFSAFRLLRILTLTWRLDSAKVIFNTMFESFPGIINLWIMGFMVWTIFAICGVQLFAGKFYHCVDQDGEKANVTHLDECERKNLTWINEVVNFDHILNANLALLEIATFKGWISLIHGAVDSTWVNRQPKMEVNMIMIVYFLAFIVLCSYNIYVMYFGVLIDGYNRQQARLEKQHNIKGPGDSIYIDALRKINFLSPKKTPQHQNDHIRSSAQEILEDVNFDRIIATTIIISIIVLAYHNVAPTEVLANTLLSFTIIFLVVYSVELAIRIVALREEFYRDAINIVDVIALLLAIISMSYNEVISHYVIPPMMLRLIRLASIFRIRRWLHRFEGILCITSTLTKVIPHILVTSFILFVVTFIYGVIGVYLFSNVPHVAAFNDYYNFDTLPNALVVLSQLFVSAGWDGVMVPLISAVNCGTDEEYLECGHPLLGTMYCVTYVLITFVLVLTILTVVIVENYMQTRKSRKLTKCIDDTSDGFYKTWNQFDPEGAGYISLQDLPSFLEMQDEPLTVARPNSNEIAIMDIPIIKGNMVNHKDVYDGLFRRFMAKEGKPVSRVDSFCDLVHQDPDYEPVSSTLWRRREIRSAKLIQKTWAIYRKKTRM